MRRLFSLLRFLRFEANYIMTKYVASLPPESSPEPRAILGSRWSHPIYGTGEVTRVASQGYLSLRFTLANVEVAAAYRSESALLEDGVTYIGPPLN